MLQNQKEMDNESIKDNICRLRTMKGLSQDEMAGRLGIVRNTYRNIEKGSVRLISSHLSNIAAALDVSMEELVLGYHPSEWYSRLQEERVKYEKKEKNIVGRYEEIIDNLKDIVEDRDKEIRDLREILDAKNEIIALIKRGHDHGDIPDEDIHSSKSRK